MPSYTPIQNNRKNYGLFYFNFYLSRQELGTQTRLDGMIGNIRSKHILICA